MSLRLDIGTKPAGLLARMDHFSSCVHVGNYTISMEDFFILAKYVLTNSDLEPDDPRLQFVECVKSMEKVDGYNPGGEHLQPRTPPVPCK